MLPPHLTVRRGWASLAVLLTLATLLVTVPISTLSPSSIAGRHIISLSRRHPLLQAPRQPFSSFQCTAGSQLLEDPLQHPHLVHHPVQANDQSLRLCLLRNVCLVNNSLTFYVDPSERKAVPPDLLVSAFLPSRLIYSNFPEANERIGLPFSVVDGARPPDQIDAINDRIYMLDAFTYVFNWAHLLQDTVIPAYAAAEVFGISIDDIQLVGLYSCSRNLVVEQRLPLSSRSVTEACLSNFANWFPLFFTHWYMFRPDGDGHNMCFRNIIAGQNSMYSLAGIFPHETSAARRMRIHLFESLGLPLHDAPVHHSIVVLEKLPDMNPIEYPELCADISRWAGNLHPAIPVQCIIPGTLNVSVQMSLLRLATVVVAEHGSTTHSGMFHFPGSTFLIVYTKSAPKFLHIKEPSSALMWNDIHVIYFDQHRLRSTGTGKAVLTKALNEAAGSLGLPRISYTTSTEI